MNLTTNICVCLCVCEEISSTHRCVPGFRSYDSRYAGPKVGGRKMDVVRPQLRSISSQVGTQGDVL